MGNWPPHLQRVACLFLEGTMGVLAWEWTIRTYDGPKVGSEVLAEEQAPTEGCRSPTQLGDQDHDFGGPSRKGDPGQDPDQPDDFQGKAPDPEGF
jgi:hypothetical protein